MLLIELDQLMIKYTGRKDPTLKDLSLQLHAGETVLLLGASGCGKSTLALTLNGLIPHALGVTISGSVCVNGIDTQQTSVATLAQQVGIVFQDPEAQFITLNVEDELLFGLENLCLPPSQMDGRVAAALAAVGMPDARQQRVDRLSGGQKQRIALAALLAIEPQVLVFDEPTANLDPIGTQDVFALLAELKAHHRHTIIVIEHKLDELMHLIDRVIVLGTQGSILADGAPRMVFRDHAAVLAAHGVWMPQVCLLAQQLNEQGIAIEPFPISIEEVAQALHDTPVAIAEPARQLTSAAVQPTLAIEVRDLSFSYGPKPVLNALSLQVPRGDFLAIVGANGAGKTTLAQHLVGILAAPRGRVLIGGHDVSRLPARELSKHVGYVFQNPEHQFICDTVFDEVAYGLRVLGLAEDEVQARSQALLVRFGLARYAPANPFTLSHGEKRRLSVASMLAMGQEVLILDEPTFGQDQRNADELLTLLGTLHDEGRTIVIVTHDMTLVAEHAQHVAVMSAGRLLFHGPTRAAFAQPALLESARLTLPPIARLAAQLAAHHASWQGVLTLNDVMRATPAMPQEQAAHQAYKTPLS